MKRRRWDRAITCLAIMVFKGTKAGKEAFPFIVHPLSGNINSFHPQLSRHFLRRFNSFRFSVFIFAKTPGSSHLPSLSLEKPSSPHHTNCELQHLPFFQLFLTYGLEDGGSEDDGKDDELLQLADIMKQNCLQALAKLKLQLHFQRSGRFILAKSGQQIIETQLRAGFR